jgi:hypothetical protein
MNMKPSENTLEALSGMTSVQTLGDVRRIIGNSLLALARKEISATDVVAMAKAVDSISNSLNSEIALAKVRSGLRDSAAELGKQVQIGATLIASE